MDECTPWCGIYQFVGKRNEITLSFRVKVYHVEDLLSLIRGFRNRPTFGLQSLAQVLEALLVHLEVAVSHS